MAKGLRETGPQESPSASSELEQGSVRAEQSAVFADKALALVRAPPQLLILTKLPCLLSYWLGWEGLFSILPPSGGLL